MCRYDGLLVSAATVLRLLRDDAEWTRLSEAGLAYAHAITSRASAHARMRRVLGLEIAGD